MLLVLNFIVNLYISVMNNSNQSSFYIVNLFFFFLMNNSIVVMKMIMIWQDFKKIYICLPSFFIRQQHYVEDPYNSSCTF